RAARTALAGQRHVKPPADWEVVYAKLAQSTFDDVRIEATTLGVTFGDSNALQSMRALVTSPQNDAAPRRNALKALLAAKDPALVNTLQTLLSEPALRDAA